MTLRLAYIFVCFCTAAVAGDDPPGHTHDGEVGKFYQSWNQPDLAGMGHRGAGCCGNADCRPARTLRPTSRAGADFEVEVLDPYLLKFLWYPVPNRIWEDVQEDPRESPDGRNHVCINGGRVICAVRAPGL